MAQNCALCNGPLAGKHYIGEHHRYVTDCVTEFQAQLWRYRDAIQRARILLNGLGHKSEDEARLVEKIDWELRTAQSAPAVSPQAEEDSESSANTKKEGPE
jgi:hypothetical protein